MQVVIPMSGMGSRFKRAGYRDPKPLIEVDDMPMIEHVVNMFPGTTDFIFVCSREHLEETRLGAVLRNAAPTARIVAIEPHKLGPVHAVLEASTAIQDDEPVIVNYCDFSVYWDFPAFCRTVEQLGCPGALTAYRGFHPHSLGPNLYAYLRHEENRLIEIREKHCFTANRMEEFASSGTYYFRSGALLKHYFRKAVDEGLTTNGEFYASTPYNLLVQDGLDVYVHELEHFLQWGTPEDLEEYAGWSEYFARSAEWRPSVTLRNCATLIPMAGDGARFAREGFALPKPLVPAGGTPMIERAFQTLPESTVTVAICREDHLKKSDLETVLNEARPGIRIITSAHRTEGQACTCLLADAALEPLEPVLVAPCDCSLIYDDSAFATLVNDESADCVVWTFRNHPHANRNPKQYGWVAAGPNGLLEAASCKTAPSGDVHRAQGITGAFWFRESRILFDSIRHLVAENRRINGEFYLDSVLTLLIEQGLRVRAFDVKHYICFGTPDDIHTFDYWESYFRKAAHHSYGKEESGGRLAFASLNRASVL